MSSPAPSLDPSGAWRSLLDAVQHAATAFAVADLTGRLVGANRAYCDLLGLPWHELAGRSFLEITHVDDVPPNRRLLGQLLAGDVSGFVLEKRYLKRDGGFVWVQVSTSLLREGVAPVALLAVVENLSRRKRVEAERDASRVREREASERVAAEQEIRRLNAELARRVAELETVLDVAPVGIAFADDPSCDRVRANRYGTELLGLPLGADVSYNGAEGEPAAYRVCARGEAVTPDKLPMQKAVRSGMEARDLEYEVQRPDGTVVQVLAHAAPLFDERRRVRGSVGVFIDVTERKRAEEELSRANAALRRSNTDLERFAYAASHDLQVPLRAIRAQAEGALRNAPEDRAVTAALRAVLDSAGRMESLVADLLAFARLGGAEARRREPVDLEAVLTWVRMSLDPALREADAEVTHGLLPVVEADGSQMMQLFQNLLSNAVKYRGPAPLRVHVGAERDGDAWGFSVQDNGWGFDPALAERIFGLFQRLHGHEIPGTGMGLAICRRIVEAHGGRIWADSQPGAGATFFFTLQA